MSKAKNNKKNPLNSLLNVFSLDTLKGIFSHEQIWKKIFFTICIIFLYRVLLAIPLPGIDVEQYQQAFGESSFSQTSYIFSLFTGGSFDSPSLVGMGIAAYINASIIIQLLTSVIPHLERLSKEGERGRELINKYTRYLTLPLAVFYAFGYVLFLRSIDESTEIGAQLAQSGIKAIFADLNTAQIISIVITLTAGTMLLMWLAELLTEVGIGNGMSIFISMNIATSLPALLANDFQVLNVQGAINSLVQDGNASILTDQAFLYLYTIIIGALLIYAAIVLITESTRKVPIQYARRVRGTENGEGSHLPLKLNQSGVIPVIFASSLLTMPQIIIPVLVNSAASMEDGAPLKSFLAGLNESFVLNTASIQYITVYVLLTIGFSFFYSFIVMKPETVAENLQKSGGFIPGIRPGKSTQEYVTKVMLRLTLVGGSFLALVAVLPLMIGNTFTTDIGQQLAVFSGIGGTSIIIIVGTGLEFYRQLNSLRISNSYEQYI